MYKRIANSWPESEFNAVFETNGRANASFSPGADGRYKVPLIRAFNRFLCTHTISRETLPHYLGSMRTRRDNYPLVVNVPRSTQAILFNSFVKKLVIASLSGITHDNVAFKTFLERQWQYQHYKCLVGTLSAADVALGQRELEALKSINDTTFRSEVVEVSQKWKP